MLFVQPRVEPVVPQTPVKLSYGGLICAGMAEEDAESVRR
jgi:hypothetical protein